MTDDKKGGNQSVPSQPADKGYQPANPDRGYNPQGGYQPTTGQGAPANPPNQGSGGKK